MSSSSNAQPLTTNQDKPSWNNCDGCKLKYNVYKVYWGRTKYQHENIPKEHFVGDRSLENITIPGIVANEIFDYAYDNQKKKFKFTPNLEYNFKQIYDLTGGVLWDVSERTEYTIEVTYLAYDHHNEPVETQKFSLVPIRESQQ